MGQVLAMNLDLVLTYIWQFSSLNAFTKLRGLSDLAGENGGKEGIMSAVYVFTVFKSHTPSRNSPKFSLFTLLRLTLCSPQDFELHLTVTTAMASVAIYYYYYYTPNQLFYAIEHQIHLCITPSCPLYHQSQEVSLALSRISRLHYIVLPFLRTGRLKSPQEPGLLHRLPQVI